MLFQRVFITPEAEKHPRAERLLASLPGLAIEKTRGLREVQNYLERNFSDPIGAGKRTLLLDVQLGEFLKPCPCTNAHVSCGYWTLNPVKGCPFDCSYCVLQEYLGPSPITVHLNWEDLFAELRSALAAPRPRPLRLGTGELSDSLALEPWLNLAPALVEFFADREDAAFELKTKSARVECLEGLPHRGKTVVAWSVNPEPIIAREEPGTAPLSARLQAAKRAAGWGYRVGFHFDPILDEPGAEAAYAQVVEEIFAAVDPGRVAWISLGALRFSPRLVPIVRERFPESRILLGEFIFGLDNKLRYPRLVRQPLLQQVARSLRSLAPEVPIYLCMETPAVWRSALRESSGNQFLIQK